MKGHVQNSTQPLKNVLPRKTIGFGWENSIGVLFAKKSPSHKYGKHFYLQFMQVNSPSPLQIVFLFKVILHTCSHLDWQPGTFWELKNGNKKPLFISELVETFEYGTIEMMRQPFWLPEEPRSHRIDVDKSQAGKRAEDQKDFSNQQ